MPHYQVVINVEVEKVKDHFVVAVVFVLSCWVFVLFCFALFGQGLNFSSV